MNIYNYNPLTGDYISTGNAMLDPITHVGYLVPANATSIAPPQFDPATQSCKFNGVGWVVASLFILKEGNTLVSLVDGKIPTNLLPQAFTGTITDLATGKSYQVVSVNGVIGLQELA